MIKSSFCLTVLPVVMPQRVGPSNAVDPAVRDTASEDPSAACNSPERCNDTLLLDAKAARAQSASHEATPESRKQRENGCYDLVEVEVGETGVRR